MSIIHDALKKVQNTTNDPAPTASASAPQTPAPAPLAQINTPAPVTPADAPAPVILSEKEVSRTLDLTIIISLALVLVLVAGVFWITRPLFAPKPSAEPVVAETPAPVPVPEPVNPLAGLRIQGIMDMGTKKAALINGHIYEEGQILAKHKITAITLETVTLISRDGTTRTLRVESARP